MCLVALAVDAHPRYGLVLAANRDEYHARPAAPASWGHDGEFRGILPVGFSFTTTITMAALYSNYRLKFIPIEYCKRVGDSSIRPVRDFFSFAILIIRIASYFEPLRFFLPLAVGFAGFGVLKGTIDFVRLGAIGALAVITVLMGVQVFITGILAEVIVRRASSAGGVLLDHVQR